ncbi:MAG: acyltransferase [Bacteroidaceae bacterium]|nr:acyltransferase [Bacteroidaceae bacterium]
MAYLESKPRYEILDGLRGVAALTVIVFHLVETYFWGDPVHQHINHGYLAVDFFFVLSGFVVGYAYDDRWGKMNTWDFFKRRLVRLHPMITISIVFGMLMFYFRGGDIAPATAWYYVLWMGVLNFFIFPISGFDGRWGETFPLTGTHWSLLLEYFANIIYAFVLRRLPTKVLALLTVVAALCSIDHALGLNTFGDMPADNNRLGTFIGGWGIDGWELHIAAVRLAFPFLVGMLLSRVKKFITVNGGFWWTALLIAIILFMPRIGGEDPSGFWKNGLYECIAVIVVFPIIIMMGAGSEVNGRKSSAICRFLGEISYPVYAMHFPFIYIQMNWVATHSNAPLSTHIFVNTTFFLLSIATAYATLKLYDEPVREWLKDKVLRKKP